MKKYNIKTQFNGYFKDKKPAKKASIYIMNRKLVLFILILVLSATAVFAQSKDDYRTINNGNWNGSSTWQKFQGNSWGNESSPPNSGHNMITIRDHTITVTAVVTIDQTTITSGGTVSINDRITVTVNNGTETDLIIDGVLTGAGNLTNSTGADIAIGSGTYNLNGTLTNNGTITLNMSQLSGSVENYGIIKSDRVDIMRDGTLTNNTGSTIEYTSVVNIPASTGYKNLSLSAPGIYYLEGDVTGIETLTLGANTYLHKNESNLGYADSNAPQRIIDSNVPLPELPPIITLASNIPAVHSSDVPKVATKYPIYRFTLTRDSTSGTVNLTEYSFTANDGVDVDKLRFWGNIIDDLSSATQIGTDINNRKKFSNIKFENLSYALIPSSTHYFWLTMDISKNSNTGDNIAVLALDVDNNLTISNAIKSGIAHAGGKISIVQHESSFETTLYGAYTVPDGEVRAGSKKNVIQRFELLSTGENILTNVKFVGDSSTDFDTNDLDKIQLWGSTTNDIDTAIKIGTDITLIGDRNFELANLQCNLMGGQRYYFWITLDVRPTATSGRKIKISALTGTQITVALGSAVTGSAPAGGTQTVVVPNVLLASEDPAVSSASLPAGTLKSPIYAFNLRSTNADILQSLSFIASGTNLTGDIDKYQLWTSTSDIFSNATQLGSDVQVNPIISEQIIFASLNHNLGSDTTSYFWLTADIASEATPGNSFTVAALQASNIVIQSSYAEGTAYAGGMQSIIRSEVLVQLSSQSPAVSASDLAPSMLKRPLHRFQLQGCGNVLLRDMNFYLEGDFSASDISRIQLWTAIEDDLNAAAQIGGSITSGLNAGTKSFSELNLMLLQNTVHYFWVTVDAAATATQGRQISISALSGSDFTFIDGNAEGNTSAGPTQTINTQSQWTKAISQTINQTTGTGTGYQVKVNVFRSAGIGTDENVYIGAQCREDFGDIRFFEGEQPLNYWMQSSTYGEKATFWIKLESDISIAPTTLTMRYGNPGATTTSNGINTFDFFDDFNRTNGNLDDWIIHRALDNSTASIPKGLNHVRLGGGIKTGSQGHIVLGSQGEYNTFTNGAIEFRYRVSEDAVAEVGFRGNYQANTGFKLRSDARSGTAGGESFLSPPYHNWSNLTDSSPGSNTPLPNTWYHGRLTVNGNTAEFYRDGTARAVTHYLTEGTGEISLQNHHGDKTDYDWVFVRKFSQIEIVRTTWGDAPVALEATAVSYTGFTARWEAFPGAETYYIDILDADGATLKVVVIDASASKYAVRIEDLAEDTSYQYRIRVKIGEAYTQDSNTITLRTLKEEDKPGYGAATSFDGEEVIVDIPAATNSGTVNNNTVIAPSESYADDFYITITYHPTGHDIWPNGRLLASITSSNPLALNGTYTINHAGMAQPAAAAWRYGDGNWHQLSEADQTANFTEQGSTSVVISGIPANRSSEVLEIIFDDSSGTLPVELSSFTARLNPYGKVKIEWVTQTETNVMGYRIYRNNIRNLDSALLLDALIEGRNSSHTQVYTYIDNDVLTPGNHYYWLECIDYDGTAQYYGPVTVNISGDSESHNQAPIVAGINHTYPNPFNPVVHIAYGVPEASTVKMNIYNVKGQYVSEIMNEYKNIGAHTFTWTGKDAYGRQLPSGLYFLRMEMNNKTWVKKITMSK